MGAFATFFSNQRSPEQQAEAKKWAEEVRDTLPGPSAGEMLGLDVTDKEVRPIIPYQPR